jgi:dye decolorizing peroxidase
MTASPPRPSRRRFLAGGALAGIGACAGLSAELIRSNRADEARPPGVADNGALTIPFHGPNQAGIDMVPQAHQTLVAVDLLPGVTRDDVRRLLTVLSGDAARMTDATPALGDSEPEFAMVPARLTVTFGFGRGLVDLVGPAGGVPDWLGPLPAFAIDRLEDRWSGGDLLLQVASDDPITVAHAVRMLLKDCRSFARLRWVQHGFRRAYGSEVPGASMRNLFGQIDGTVNPVHGSADLAGLVWEDGSRVPWLAGGTSMVVRRITMQLDKWDRLDRSGREAAMGRKLGNGAPLTGEQEHDEPDFAATTPIGFLVIPEFAHVRRARSQDTRQRFLRRGYNYDVHPSRPDEISDSGLIFQSFQRDVTEQFVPVQQRLAELDLMNEWTVPIGSAVFVVPPGCRPGGFVGETLF